MCVCIGELKPTEGSVGTVGRVAFLAQQAFIQAGTVRENVLFGQKLDQPMYRKVLEVKADTHTFIHLHPWASRKFYTHIHIYIYCMIRLEINDLVPAPVSCMFCVWLLQACALDRDLEALSQGDLTVIGEKGTYTYIPTGLHIIGLYKDG